MKQFRARLPAGFAVVLLGDEVADASLDGIAGPAAIDRVRGADPSVLTQKLAEDVGYAAASLLSAAELAENVTETARSSLSTGLASTTELAEQIAKSTHSTSLATSLAPWCCVLTTLAAHDLAEQIAETTHSAGLILRSSLTLIGLMLRCWIGTLHQSFEKAFCIEHRTSSIGET